MFTGCPTLALAKGLDSAVHLAPSVVDDETRRALPSSLGAAFLAAGTIQAEG